MIALVVFHGVWAELKHWGRGSWTCSKIIPNKVKLMKMCCLSFINGGSAVLTSGALISCTSHSTVVTSRSRKLPVCCKTLRFSATCYWITANSFKCWPHCANLRITLTLNLTLPVAISWWSRLQFISTAPHRCFCRFLLSLTQVLIVTEWEYLSCY